MAVASARAVVERRRLWTPMAPPPPHRAVICDLEAQSAVAVPVFSDEASLQRIVLIQVDRLLVERLEIFDVHALGVPWSQLREL